MRTTLHSVQCNQQGIPITSQLCFPRPTRPTTYCLGPDAHRSPSLRSASAAPLPCPNSHATTPQRHKVKLFSSSSSSSSVTHVGDYLRRGPHVPVQQPQLSFDAGMGSSGPMECTVEVTLPQGLRRCPLLLFSPGFLLRSALYRSYAQHLASHGIATAAWDLPELVDDSRMVEVMRSVLDTCMRRVPELDPSGPVLLAGHSRGGKLSVLAAAADPRVGGVALLDPVDVTAMTPLGPGYPSALPAMRLACSPPRRLPCLVVGAALGGDVVPPDANYTRFISACPGPRWTLELRGAGHLQFLDAQVGLLSMFSKGGPTPDAAVRAVSAGALAAWAAELALPLARGQALSGPLVAERLQRASEALAAAAPLSYTVGGLEPWGGAPAAGGGGGATNGCAVGTAGGAAAGAGWGSGAAAAAAGWAGWAAGAGSSSANASGSSTSSSGSRAESGGGSGSERRSRSWSSSWQAPPPPPPPGAGVWGGGDGAAAGQAPGGRPAAAERAAGAAGARASSGSGSGSASSRSGAGSGTAAAGGASGTPLTYESLVQLRARQLKALCAERGIGCEDCFEKEDLVRRLLGRG